MAKLPIVITCMVLLSIICCADGYELGNYTVSFRYPVNIIKFSDTSDYEDGVIISDSAFLSFSDIERAFLDILNNNFDKNTTFIDFEICGISIVEIDRSIQANVSSMFIDPAFSRIKNRTINKNITNYTAVENIPISKIEQPYPGWFISIPLKSGLSLNQYYGLITDRVCVGLLVVGPTESFTKALSTLKVTPIRNSSALKSSKTEPVTEEKNISFFWDSIDIWKAISAILTIIGLIITIVLYFHSRKTKSLGYEILAETSLLTVNKDIHEKIKIYFEDKLIQNAWLLIYKIVNNGNMSITKDDFDGDISVSFDKEITVLSAQIVKTNPENLKATLNRLDSEIVLKPLLMNSLDSITINIILSNYVKDTLPAPKARIAGVSQVKYIDESKIKNSKLIFRSKHIVYATIFFVLLLGLIVLGSPMTEIMISTVVGHNLEIK